jgi:hypothetical protein
MGALVAKYRKPMSQETLAELVSEKAGRTVRQGLISELEKGSRWGKNLDLIGSIADVLHIPPREVQQAMGLPWADDDPGEKPRSFAEIIAQDASLSKTAKEHLLDQYEMLQMVTMHQRRGEPGPHQNDDDSHGGRGRARKRA